MLSVLDAPLRVAEADIAVHAFGASIQPEIVCKPFLNESRKVTLGTSVVSAGSDDFTSISRVRGTEIVKDTKTTNAIIAAETKSLLWLIS
jgi:hypothetical protein